MHFVSGWFFFYDFTPIFFIKTIDKDGVGCYNERRVMFIFCISFTRL